VEEREFSTVFATEEAGGEEEEGEKGKLEIRN